ncbi:ABC transporter ATP-binding protein [Fenollaria sporofastidiosus]|uniref:ABC transporter ATP-binding protein n=1 Tax=Fenollaria sporofastidiosus TaxID=2811778 RepID=UPI001C0016EC|nr:ABC transporter ATP-binding protein [Fenollaria sporofastidiosus]
MRKLSLIKKYIQPYIFIYLLAFLFEIMSSALQMLIPIILGTTIDSIIGSEEPTNKIMISFINLLGGRDLVRERLGLIAVAFITISFTIALLNFLRPYMSGRATYSISKGIRDNIYAKISSLSIKDMASITTGDMLQRASSDITQFESIVSTTMMALMGNISYIIISLITLFTINLKLSLASIALLPILFVGTFIFDRKVVKTFDEFEKSEARLTSIVQENLSSYKVVRAFFKQKHEIEKFEEANMDLAMKDYKIMEYFAFFWSIAEFICFLQIALTAIFGVLMHRSGAVSLGEFTAVFAVAFNMVWVVLGTGRMLSRFTRVTVAIRRFDEVLEMDSEDLDKGIKDMDIKGGLVFDKVNFAYDQTHGALKDLSFSIDAGKTLGVLGLTGSGKSTLVSLIPRLMDYEGSIKVDGVELNTIAKRKIRENTSIILQEPYLFNKSIKENIAYRWPEASDEEIIKAAKIADIHDDIMNFPDGYDTIVGEKGVSLSGGQKQRLAIARTILVHTPIIIFDDALSAVDTQTDINIRTALSQNEKAQTKIIISHRISTLMNADKIIVMKRGKKVQEGTHEELIHEDGLYKTIYDIQNIEVD